MSTDQATLDTARSGDVTSPPPGPQDPTPGDFFARDWQRIIATRTALAAAAPHGAFATAVQASVDDLGSVLAGMAHPSPRPLLVGFPFNVFGNLPDPRRTVATVAGTRADVVILTYDTSAPARAARTEYYRACGFAGTPADDATGSHFAYGAFTSSVYHPPVLTGWLAAQGYRVTVRRYGTIGLAYHGVLRSTGHLAE